MTTDVEFIELLYRAMNAKYGIKITCDDAQRLRGKLTYAKKKADDPALDNLVFETSPYDPKHQLFLRKKKPNE